MAFRCKENTSGSRVRQGGQSVPTTMRMRQIVLERCAAKPCPDARWTCNKCLARWQLTGRKGKPGRLGAGMHLWRLNMSTKAKLYIVLTALAGMTALVTGLDPWKSDDLVRFVCYLLISTLASGLKVNLPGITGTMSVNFLF